MSIRVEELNTTHQKEWELLWQDYLHFYNEALPDEITQATWEKMLDEQEKMYGLVAYHNNKMIGFVNYIFHRSTWAKGYYCYLEDLFVAEDARRKGIAKALIYAVREKAKQNNCERLYWVTGESNPNAQMLYNKIAEKTEYFQYRLSLDK